MNRPCKELKRISRKNLAGQYRVPMGALLVSWMIPQIIRLLFSMTLSEHPGLLQTVTLRLAGLLIALVSYVLAAGIAVIHLNLARGREVSLDMVLIGFREHADRFVLTGIFQILAILLGMLPFLIGYTVHQLLFHLSYIILGILLTVSTVLTVFLSLNLFLALYLVIDQPECSVWSCIRSSIERMCAHKKRLFYIYLSFSGLLLVCLLSFGIGVLWVQPYQEQTLAIFYLDVTGQLEAPANASVDASRIFPPTQN